MRRLAAAFALVFGATAMTGFLITAHAAQRIDVQDGITSMAQISAKEPTRIRVDGSPIIDVLGNVYHRDKNPGGEIIIEEDKTRGEIFVRPAGLTQMAKPINLFIMTGQATFTLLLHPVDVPADTIVLFDRSRRVAAPSVATSTANADAVRNLILAMASDRVPATIRVSEMGAEIALRPDVRFTLQRRYEAQAMTGDRFLLTHVGREPIVLSEQAFWKEGVLAVAIDRPSLMPGDSTAVFVITTEGTR
ncbi:MAG: type-F conjugative transfer system secretin TraK [Betaproteobacteria bacterium]|nr:type-F conjugative transfer system secretin TraK [Betaproteobacteria bacterium]